MQCAMCRDELKETYFEVMGYRPNKECCIMYLCCECVKSLCVKDSMTYVMHCTVQKVPRRLCQKPLREFAKPQVDGLF